TGELEQNGARLDDGHVVFDRTLALTHPHLSGLLGHGLVREHADPEFAFALQVTRYRDAGRLDLLAGHGTAGERLKAEFAESERVAALGIPGAGALHRLPVLGAGG